MGMYDSVFVRCPKCLEGVTEFQSKAGERTLAQYGLDNAPEEILLDLNGDRGRCDKCQHLMLIESRSVTVTKVVASVT